MPRPPWIIVFDLDGTLLGDVTAYACEYALLTNAGVRLEPLKRAIVDAIDDGLVRPGFGALLDALAAVRDRAHFFAYTAAEGPWARLVCACLERRFGVRFEHVFARAYCVKNGATFELEKSVARVYPTVKKLMLARHGVVLPKDPVNHVVVIDNAPTFPPQEAARMVLHCPSYTGAAAGHDVLRFLPPATLRKSFADVAGTMMAYGMLPAAVNAPSSLGSFLKMHYRATAARAYAAERRRAPDQYMQRLAHCVRASSADDVAAFCSRARAHHQGA